jgi:hypothetical protein
MWGGYLIFVRLVGSGYLETIGSRYLEIHNQIITRFGYFEKTHIQRIISSRYFKNSKNRGV